jgi:peroxiredoxin
LFGQTTEIEKMANFTLLRGWSNSVSMSDYVREIVFLYFFTMSWFRHLYDRKYHFDRVTNQLKNPTRTLLADSKEVKKSHSDFITNHEHGFAKGPPQGQLFISRCENLDGKT